MLYKRGVLKNFSKFSDKHKEQSSGGVLSKDVLKNFVKFTEKNIFAGVGVGEAAAGDCANFSGKNLCWSLFLIKLEF